MGWGDWKHVEYIIPIPTFLSSDVFSFHPLYSSLPISTGSLCLFLPYLLLFSSALKYYFETYLFLILSLSLSSSQLFSVTFLLSFMGIFICCRALNTPDHGIQSLNRSIQGVEDTNTTPECRMELVRMKGRAFVNEQISLYSVSFLPVQINLLQWSPVCCNSFKTHISIGITASIPLLTFFGGGGWW